MQQQRFERNVHIYPGEDNRASNKGWSCAEMLFILTDTIEAGAATFAVRTNWPPPGMERGFIRPADSLTSIDLTYHFAVPTMTADQDKHLCPYINGPCYSITDRKNGAMLVDVLRSVGSKGLWVSLERLFEQEARIQRPRIRGGI